MDHAPSVPTTATVAGGASKRADHPPALALRADGAVRPLSTGGRRLVGLLPDPRCVTAALRLAVVETPPLYSDGPTEARVGTLYSDGPTEARVGTLYSDGPTEARAGTWAMLGGAGLITRLSAIRPRGSGAPPTVVDELPGGLDAGVTDDTALFARPVPSPRDEPTAQEQLQ
ncbi:SpoIIE family protein phosphatase [Streptomyces fagopyri]|uniref:SpoIIE family protein phosphatase n=1 Tax=Streptomyces fagopyri TaxID=2662397 RepID=UPI00371002D0